MIHCIKFLLWFFFKKWSTAVIIGLFFIITLIQTTIIAKQKNKDGFSILDHISWVEVILPYAFSCFFITMLIFSIFKSKGINLPLIVKPVRRHEMFIAKLVVFALSIIFSAVLVFIANALVGNIDKFKSSKTVTSHAFSLSLGSIIVTFAFGSFAILIAQFANTIFYCITTTLSIMILPIFSMIIMLVAGGSLNQLKDLSAYPVQTVQKNSNSSDVTSNSNTYLVGKQPPLYSFSKLAPLDVFYQWNSLYGVGQSSSIENKASDAIAYNKAIRSPQLINGIQSSLTISDSNFISYAMLEPRYGSGEVVNNTLLEIIANKSTSVYDPKYVDLIKKTFESNELSIFQKLVLVDRFGSDGNFGWHGIHNVLSGTTSLAPLPYSFDSASSALDDFFNIYDVKTNHFKSASDDLLYRNDSIWFSNDNYDFKDAFMLLHDIIDTDSLVANTKLSIAHDNNFHGMFNTKMPVSNLYQFKPWMNSSSLVLFWFLVPFATLAISGVLYSRKDFRG